jgi:hypothetical protein
MIAPDLRGFGASEKPQEVDPYRITRSVADVVAILDAGGIDRTHLSVGHPNTQAPSIEQREKSWYVLLFQFEGLAEELLAKDDWALLRDRMHGQGDLDRAIEGFREPGALTADRVANAELLLEHLAADR